jgi:hypothetical protein
MSLPWRNVFKLRSFCIYRMLIAYLKCTNFSRLSADYSSTFKKIHQLLHSWIFQQWLCPSLYGSFNSLCVYCFTARRHAALLLTVGMYKLCCLIWMQCRCIGGGAVGWGIAPQDVRFQFRFPVDFLEILQWPIPSVRMQLESTQPLIEIVRRNFLGGKVR